MAKGRPPKVKINDILAAVDPYLEDADPPIVAEFAHQQGITRQYLPRRGNLLSPQSGDGWGRHPCFAVSARLMYCDSAKRSRVRLPGGVSKILSGGTHGRTADRIPSRGRADAV